MTRVSMIVVGSVVCFLALAGISAQAQSFSDTVTYTLVSENPGRAATGDLDGDGLADLAVASSYDVSWLANNGDGTFAAPQSYPFQNIVIGLDIGEMEADTDLDLVVLERGGSSSAL